MMINLHVIASGSKGNASIIYSEKTTILVDLGVSKERLIEGLSEINKSIDDIDFAFFTHSHADHIKNAHLIDISKCYGLSKTLDFLPQNVLKNYIQYDFKDFKVTPIKTSHDVLTSCGFLFECENEKLAYITDTGMLSKKSLSFINNADYYYMESNYDETMLLESSRPRILKDRILSNKGHLSNEQSANYLVRLIGDKTKKIILAHLSEECNNEELALNTHYLIYRKNGIIFDDIEIIAAKQWSSVDLWLR